MPRISHNKAQRPKGAKQGADVRRGERPLKGGKKKQTLFDLIGQTGPQSDFDFEPPRLSDDMGFRIPDFSEDKAPRKGPRRQPMSVTKLASREFNQDVGRAKRAAEKAPVVITDRGTPAFVLMKYADYERLLGKRPSIADLLNHEETKDLEFEPVRMRDGWLHAADLD